MATQLVPYLNLLSHISNITGKDSAAKKREILKENDNEILRFLLKTAFDPFWTNKCHKLKIEHSPIDNGYEINFENFKQIIKDLNDAVAINKYLHNQVYKFVNGKFIEPEATREHRILLSKIIDKSLSIGLAAKGINKALGEDLIFNSEVMLAKSDFNQIHDFQLLSAEQKYDGTRMIAIYNIEKNKFEFFTRNFRELDDSKLSGIKTELQSHANQLLKIFENESFFIDGELTDENRQDVSGKVNQILRGTATDNIDQNFIFNVFDIEKTQILGQKSGNIPYHVRREILSSTMGHGFGFNRNKVNIVKHALYYNDSINEIINLHESIVKQGGEGLIIKDYYHVYEPKRSNKWIKTKEEKDCDLKIIDYYMGKGKRSGLIGGLTCQSKDGELQVNVGSGLSDEQLEHLTENIDNYLNTIVKITYNTKIKDKHGYLSLFLPRIKEFRADKDTADLSNKIK